MAITKAEVLEWIDSATMLELNDLVKSVLILYAENSARAGIEDDLDPGLAPVLIDPDRMSEVINNLLVNAVQAMGPAGGGVTVSTRSGGDGAERSSTYCCPMLHKLVVTQ